MKIKFKVVTIAVISLVLASVLLFSGCNTTEGFGKDLEAGGKNIQKTAVDNNKK